MATKYKIWYDVGFGREEETIEASNEDEAGEAAYEAFEAAYEAFSEACESQHNWGFEELPDEEEPEEATKGEEEAS